ncbi:MAG: universal stress protein [Alphaproteobacteria bacterium]|nr:universal stress protein [Alphaproteobacteria bacterium]
MSDSPHEPQRVFLVVIDDSEEMKVALRFACQRARHTGGRVALFRAIEPVEFQHWMGVGELMREEARAEAEALMERMSEMVVEISGTIPVLYLREGPVREELMKLIDEEPTISILVLGADTNADNPGPLVSYLSTKGAARLRIPITIVPGTLTDKEIDGLT